MLRYIWSRFAVPMDDRSLDFIETGQRFATIHQLNALLYTYGLVPTRGVGQEIIDRFKLNPRYAHVTPNTWDQIVSVTIPQPAKTRLQRFERERGSMSDEIPSTLKITLTSEEAQVIDRALLRRRVHGQPHTFTAVASEIVADALRTREPLDYEVGPDTDETRGMERSFRVVFTREQLEWIRSATKGLPLRTWVRLLILDRLRRA